MGSVGKKFQFKEFNWTTYLNVKLSFQSFDFVVDDSLHGRLVEECTAGPVHNTIIVI